MQQPSLYQIHGLMQFIAFGILFPLGAIVALLRYRIGEGWYKVHVGIQLLATSFVVVALALVHIAKAKSTEKPKLDPKYLRYHKIVGPLVVALLALQICWAFFGRKLIEGKPWLYIHIILAIALISLGWFNIYIGRTMTKPKTNLKKE